MPRAGRLTGSRHPGARTSRANALAWLAETFDRAGIEAPKREARLALRQAAGVSAAALIAAPDALLGAVAGARLAEIAERRAGGEPLSKIAGRREFWGLDFIVSRDVLDPRPETETVVEAALGLLADRRGDALRILDLGVGSGALLAALLVEFAAATGLGVDASAAAAAIAQRNLAALGLAGRGKIRVGSWTDGVSGPFDLIVSNPPYIRTDDMARLPREVAGFDPALALDGGADGLDAYRAIAPAAARLLAPGGRLIVEIGAGQAEDVLTIVAEEGFADRTTRRDLVGVERVVAASLPQQAHAEG